MVNIGFSEIDVNMSWLTSVFKEKKSMLYYPIYNIFHASGSLFISLTTRLPHAYGNLKPFVTLTLRAVETTLVTINHGLTLAHSRLGLNVTHSLSLSVSLSLSISLSWHWNQCRHYHSLSHSRSWSRCYYHGIFFSWSFVHCVYLPPIAL